MNETTFSILAFVLGLVIGIIAILIIIYILTIYVPNGIII